MRTRLVLLILFTAAIRLSGIQNQSLWFDEGWSAYAAARPNLIAAFNADLTNPPLYYVLLNAHAALAGDSEFSLRLFSLFMGLLTIPLAYQLGKRTAGESAGWYAALLVTLSAPLWWASQEARMYTLLAVLILIAALAWDRLLKRPARAAWLALIAAELLLLYAHNTGVVAALWLNVVTGIAWIARRKLDRPHWCGWIVSQIIVGVIWLPYFVTRFLNLSEANAAVTSAPQITPALIGELWQSFLSAPYALVNQAAGLIALAALIGGVALLTLRRRALWLWLHGIILTAGLIAALIVLSNNFHGRYLVMIAPLLLAALGVGMARSPVWLRVIGVIAFAALFVVNRNYGQNPLYGHDDARGMAQYYADHLSADDTVLAWSYADRYELAYYWDRLGVAARRVTLPEGADLDQVLPLLPTSGGVALNVWYTQRADYRGMMDCLLQHGSTQPPEDFTVYGMTSRLYRSPAPLSPDLTPAAAAFTDNTGTPLVRVDAVGAIPSFDAAAGMCIPIRVTLLADTSSDLKAALIVQNVLGWEIARADAPFATADQRTSASLDPGAALTAYPLIRLPYGAPPGDYPVYLRVYDESAAISGLTPPADQPASGRDLLLGTWSAPSAAWEIDPAQPNVSAQPDPHAALSNGDSLRLEIVWNIAPQIVRLRGENWLIDIRPNGDSAPLRDWHTLRIPVDAVSGTAALTLQDGTTLHIFEIVSRPLITEPPPFDHPLNVEFPGIGELIGYTVNVPPYTRDNPPQITLIWRAGADAITTDYTVFAQLIGADGAVIAQSDQYPGDRPTSSWRAGEYVIDAHALTYNVEPRDGTLYVGLYDARTNTRVRLADGADAVQIDH
jgi:uncharacterized membrane protein